MRNDAMGYWIDTGWTGRARQQKRIVLVLVVVFLWVGCGGNTNSPSSEGPQFVTTIPPFAAILIPVVGDQGTVVGLLDAGDSPHTYEPRPSDVRQVDAATALFYGAPSLDGWAVGLPAARRVALLDLVPAAFQRPALEGGHADVEDTSGTDPHFWTDPMAVRALLPALVDTLCALDGAGCAAYRSNADSLADRLTDLDADIRDQLDPIRDVPVLLAQPFFQYFMHRYGPTVVDVVEPQPAHEPSPRALQALVRRAQEAEARAVFVQRQLPPRAAEAVAEGADLPVVVLDPLGGTEGRRTYADLIRYNAGVIRDALLNPPTP